MNICTVSKYECGNLWEYIYANINWKSNWQSNYIIWHLLNYSNSLNILRVDGTIEQRKAIISLFVPFCCFFLCRPEPRTNTEHAQACRSQGERGAGEHAPFPPHILAYPYPNADYAHRITTPPPRFSDLPTALTLVCFKHNVRKTPGVIYWRKSSFHYG